MNAFLALLVAYVVGLIFITYYSHKNLDKEGYLIADRSRSWWQVMFSKYAASVGAGWFIAYGGFAYEFGLPLGIIFLGAVAGILLYAYKAVPKVRTIAGDTAYTQSDFVFKCTESKVAKELLNVAVATLIILTLLIAVVGAATLLDTYGFMRYEVAVPFTMAVIVLYIFFSGFRAVMLTDILQGALLMLLLGILVTGMLMSEPLAITTLLEVRDISVLGITMLMVFGFVSVFADPTRYQVTFAGSTIASVTKGLVWTTVPLVVTAIGVYLIGSSVYQDNALLESAEVFPYALSNFLPLALVPFGFLLFFVALMSTVDSYLYALSSHTAHFFSRSPLDVKSIRIATIVYSVLIIAISLVYRDVVDIAILTGAVMLIIAIPMMYLIFGGRNGTRFTLLLIGGSLGALGGIFTLGLIPDSGAFVLVGFLAVAFIPTRFFDRLAG